MAKITISHLGPSSDFFSDTESCMRDLSEEELNIQGGLVPLIMGLALYGPTLLGLGIAWAAGEL